jgi:hypothetical protein
LGGGWEGGGGNAVVIQIPRHQQQHSNKKKRHHTAVHVVSMANFVFSYYFFSLSLSRPALDYAIDTFIINGSDFGFYNIVVYCI